MINKIDTNDNFSGFGLAAARILCIIWLFLNLVSCNAPRINPLDPENPANHYHQINGQVQTFSLPRVPLENVSVIWSEMEMTVYTNTDGMYSIETIGAQDNWVFFEKAGYFPDSSFIIWENQKTLHADMYLNTRPSLDSLNLYSVILNRYPSLQTEQVVAEAWISDPDNDIDSVQVLLPSTEITISVPYNTTLKLYERTFSIFDIGVDRLEDLVGVSFQLSVKDNFDHFSIFDIGSITRVIRDEVHFRTPSGNEITGPNPTLVWDIFTPGFNFTYILEIFTADITPQLQWRADQIEMSAFSFTVDTPLPDGPYYWVIWAVDSFGNRTRSKPASFTVEQDCGLRIIWTVHIFPKYVIYQKASWRCSIASVKC